MAVSLANGQLAATQTAIFNASGTAASGQANVPSGDCRVNVALRNTSASTTEVVILATKLGAGTAVTLPQMTLAPKYGAWITNLPIDALDVLLAQTTNATTVDYRVSLATGSGPLEVRITDANGNLGSVSPLAVSFNGTIGVSTAAAGSSTSDAGALPAGTANIYPTTAANGTTGVKLNVADQVTGRTVFIGNGVSNAVLKVYGPTGAVINGASADAAYSSASGKGVWITCLSGAGNTWLATG